MNSLKQTDYVYFTKSVIESNLSASGAKLFIGTINDGFCVI
jgi:hypothetical protein